MTFMHTLSVSSSKLKEHLKFQEKTTFIEAFWVNNSKSKLKKVESGDYTFLKCYMQGKP